MKRLPFKVAPFRDPKRSHLRFIVTGKLNGQRQRKFFTSEGEAKTYAQLKNTQTLQEGAEAAAFPPLLRAMAQKANDMLAPLNVTIQEAAEHYAKHVIQLSRSCSLEQLFTEAIAAKRSAVLSADYLKKLKAVGIRLCTAFPNRLVAEITTREINEYLRSILSWAPSTRNSERIMLQIVFGFAQENGYCLTNVVEKTIIAKTVPSPVGILAVDELTRLLCECPGGILPYVAIGAFAGLRAAELMRLDWRDVHLDDGCIEVTAQNAKSSRRRIVKIHPCLDAWLRPILKTSGKVAPDESVIHDYRKEACKRAGIKEWPKNALRHSFASYHIAHFKDAASLGKR